MTKRMSYAAPKRPPTVDIDGHEFVEIGAAAKFARLSMVRIRERETEGWFALRGHEGKTLVPLSAVIRLRRETKDFRAADKLTRVERERKPGKVHPHARIGPHSAHREKQDVLPMDSGRGGSGWIGGRK